MHPNHTGSGNFAPEKERNRGLSQRDAWLARRLLVGHALNGELDVASDTFRPIIEHIGSLDDVTLRDAALQGYLIGRTDREAMIMSLAAADPDGPVPEADDEDETPIRYATVADVRRVQSDLRWLWKGWLPAGRLIGIAGAEGTGKTRLGLDLIRRIWHELPWPDGQGMTLAKGTPSLWIAADGHQDEFAETLEEFGVPDEAIVFPTPHDDPYGGTSIDDPETLAHIDNCMGTFRPGLVFVDTLTSATGADLCDQRSMKPIRDKLSTLAQRHQIPIILLLHMSREGQALGRRIKGLTRTLLYVEAPEPTQSSRLRLWVEKTYSVKPPPLGLTMTAKGNEYDHTPPDAVPRSKNRAVGRPPEKRDAAAQFVRDALKEGGPLIVNKLAAAWEAAGEKNKKSTLWTAVDWLAEQGEIVKTGGSHTGTQTEISIAPEQEEVIPDDGR